jgi:exodeoxyribonuclease V gamma subunit
VQEAGIKWGIDEQSRKQLGLPAFAENTWAAGLKRLLLGYALPLKDHQTYAGILPYDLIEGNDALVLGMFVEFADRLFKQVASLGEPRSLKAWSEALTELLEDLFNPDEAAQSELQAIRLTLKELAEIGNQSGFAGEVNVKVAQSYLRHRLERNGFGFGFISGGVTFCAMLPMRSIPNKVICLVGMNNDAYPRQSKTLGFDLMAKHPQKGDRSRRNDDRYLFLEAILSAREKLYISYVGQSIQDNSSIPPSVLVSELMDYVERGFTFPGESVIDKLLTRHRLQAFSPEYFKNPGGRMFSYSDDNCRAAGQMTQVRPPPADFFSEPLSSPEDSWKVLDLSGLCAFFSNPAKFLLNRRLGVYLGQQLQAPEQSELFEVKQLNKYSLEQDLIESKLEGHDPGRLFSAKKAEGLLPHGTPGECTYEAFARNTERFLLRTEPYLKDPIIEPIGIELKIADFRLTGTISDVYAGKLIHYRYARLRPVDHLRLWLHHLALSAAFPATGFHSCLIGLPANRKEEWTSFEYSSPAAAASELLEGLLDIYWQGLVRPVHFFPKSSWAYAAELLKKPGSTESALRKAASEWKGSDFSVGEQDNPYYELCFRYTDPVDEELQALADRVYRPLLSHQREAKG